MLLAQFRTAIAIVLLMTALAGVVYPLAMTGLAQVLFPNQANGSLIERDGQAIGSALLGQSGSFVDADSNRVLPGFFRGRPSAASVTEDGLLVSSGSNLGPTNRALIDRVAVDVATIREENGLADGVPIPVDLVTTSASGLDPHISPAAAELQVARVAEQRGLGEEEVRSLVAAHTEGRQFGFLGEPRVRVLELNVALDDAAPVR
jgi:K+-transporting ATPase ATPase C chain